jgi:hypothetical protein
VVEERLLERNIEEAADALELAAWLGDQRLVLDREDGQAAPRGRTCE